MVAVNLSWNEDSAVGQRVTAAYIIDIFKYKRSDIVKINYALIKYIRYLDIIQSESADNDNSSDNPARSSVEESVP